MAFWIRNDSGGDYTVSDLGITIPTAEEKDLYEQYYYEDIEKSTDLRTAFTASDLVRLDGPGGSPVTPGTEFDDAVNTHTLDGDGHEGTLGIDQIEPINDLTEKVAPVSADILLVEDSADSWNRKKVQVGNLPSGGGGEANTASNQGAAGVGFYDTKVGVDIQFRNLNSTSDRIGVVLDAGNKEVDVTLNEGNVVHQNLSGAGTNTHGQLDTHVGATDNPHATDIENLGSGTLAELNSAVTDATLDDSGDARTPTSHAASHQNGGGDEVSVSGLSGVLADPQTPTSHATAHESGGGDVVPHQNLSGAGTNTHAQIDTHVSDVANPHATDVGNLGSGTLAELNTALTDATLDDSSSSRTPTLHAASHKGGGGDAIDTATTSLAGLLSSTDKTKLDGLGTGNLLITVRNETGSTIPAGTLVAASGWSVGNNATLVVVADKDDGAARPAIGVLQAALADVTNGDALIAGSLIDIDTSGWAVTDQLVLGNAGAFSRPPPDVDPFTGEVQNVGSVTYVDAAAGIIQLIPDGMNAVTSQQIFALAGSSGTPSKTNPYVTDVDVRLTTPSKSFRVAASGGDYTSVKSAIDAAIAAGASVSDPYEIVVYAGTYTEDPMTIVGGITVTNVPGNRNDTALVVANNAAEDLFTCSGGSLVGLEISGVTDAAKALIRCATASTLTVLHGVSFHTCATGVHVSNGASVVATSISINITGLGQTVTTGIYVTGLGSYFGAVGGFFSVPSGLIPFYATNPVQTVLRVADQSEAYLAGITARIANKDATPDVLFADGGSLTTVMASEISNCYRGAHVGSVGTATTVVVQGCSFTGNTINGQADSATAVVLVNATTDTFSFTGVAGSVLSGVIQSKTYSRTFLAGLLSYSFEDGKVMALEEWFHDQTSTGVAWPETTLVTAGTGLNVDVAEGYGWVSRHSPEHDSFNVTWDAGTVALTASTTNYVGYDSTTSSLTAVTSLPGSTTVLLATVVTDGSGIRYIHRTRDLAHDTQARLQEYLVTTRKIILHSGLAAVAGSTGTRFEVDSGSYYRGIDDIPYTGTGTDIVFSYFYGTNGATEVASQTDVSTTQYDSSGTLTAMTASYYRSDTVVLTSDGNVSIIYGTAEFAVEQDAINTDPGSTPTFIQDSGIRLARLIVQQGNAITTFVDERPVDTVSGTGGTAITVHGDLSGLAADDHSQYLLTTGTRAMGGGLDMGGNAISNVGNVDGVDVSAHAARHLPGAADALTVGTPVATQVGAAAAEGTAANFARSDHQHGIGSATASNVALANAEGTASTTSRSDHVHSGLTRGADDFAEFTLKVTPTTSDVLLIEDAADTNNKKNITIGSLPGAVDSTAIHKATDAEISAMTAKTIPVSADVFVIEDSAASFAKKKVTLANVLVQNFFGTEAQDAESLGESSTTSTSWVNKLTMNTPSLPVGRYRVGWSYEIRCSNSIGDDMLARVQVDATTTLHDMNVEPKDVRSYYPFSGFGYVNLTAATHTVTLDYSTENGDNVIIRNARLEIWRIS